MNGISCRVVEVVDNASVGEEQGAIGVRRGDGVVGDHDDRLAKFVDRGPHERQDLCTGVGVEVAGRFVCEDDLRTAGERPRHGDALLLTAGELGWSVLESVLQPHGFDNGVEPGDIGSAAGKSRWELDVLGGVERWHEVERLEDEPDAVAAQLCELAVVEF